MTGRIGRAVLGVITVSLIAGCSVDAPSAPQTAGPLLIVDLQAPVERICMPDSEFEIGGAALEASQQQVIAAVGAPDQITDQPNHMDDWVDNRFIYDGLSVDFLQGRVVNLRATTPQWRTPSGMSVGMSEQELLTLFGVVPSQNSFDDQRYYEVYFCRFNATEELLGSAFQIFIDDTNTVSEISIFTDTP